ncbi:hypothetical protein AVEN_228325-1 [Araneus ventricosus]|uniref:Tc1-like transposase DDE domain-containing protein n=1 Tax=Araneus ventricosus TaxID=182803 RepID=A0A4Y2TRD6_ARAVE|nr:hypothetical protein AVEN_228325-1 [Araneus ventricosus]
MDWPAKYPDLNTIEHVWDALGRAVATRKPPPRTIQEMKTALLNEWDQLPQEMINCLISSMKSRCKACISICRNWRSGEFCASRNTRHAESRSSLMIFAGTAVVRFFCDVLWNPCSGIAEHVAA